MLQKNGTSLRVFGPSSEEVYVNEEGANLRDEILNIELSLHERASSVMLPIPEEN